VAEQRGEPVWVSNIDLQVDGVNFRAQPMNRFPSTPDNFCLWKRPGLVRQYLRLLQRQQPRTIVELGIFRGGSAALMALLARPDKLLAVDLSEERITALDELAAAHGLAVEAHYGVDQSDAATLTRLVDDAFGDRPLDLVVDDASHYFEATEVSFNVLFPRLRPGGKYVIEDWGWAHHPIGEHRPNDEPLTTLVFETVMAIPSETGLVRDVHVFRDWAVVTRGPGEVDPAGYDIASTYDERGRNLVVGLRDRKRTISAEMD
jgi:SAM-dependent methyltransferase